MSIEKQSGYRSLTDEEMKTIIKNALNEGYEVRRTEWLDEWERDMGEPSVCYELDEGDLEEYEYNPCLILEDYPKDGCAELNFVKDDEYINFYHIERTEEYFEAEAIEAFLY